MVPEGPVNTKAPKAPKAVFVWPQEVPSHVEATTLAEKVLEAKTFLGKQKLNEAAAGLAAYLSDRNPGERTAMAKALFICANVLELKPDHRKELYFKAGPGAEHQDLWHGTGWISIPSIEGLALRTLQFPHVPTPHEDPKSCNDRLSILQKSLDRLSHFVEKGGYMSTRNMAHEAFGRLLKEIGGDPSLEEKLCIPRANRRPEDAERKESLLKGRTREEVNHEVMASLVDQFEKGNKEEILKAMANVARFWKYSPNNKFLILFQDPNATVVASAKAWKDAGYQITKGQRGIEIWVPWMKQPVEKKDPEQETGNAGTIEEDSVEEADRTEEKRKNFMKFIIGHVYDIRQMEPIPGVPQKDVMGTNLLSRVQGDGDQTALDIMCDALHQENIEVEFTDQLYSLDPLHNGTSMGGRILVRDSRPVAEKLRVLAHEWAHEILHQGPNRDRGDSLGTQGRELEADATACVVMHYLGVDATQATWAYLTGYGIKREQIESAMPMVLKTADTIRKKLEEASKARSENEAKEDAIARQEMEPSSLAKDPGRVEALSVGSAQGVVLQRVVQDLLKGEKVVLSDEMCDAIGKLDDDWVSRFATMPNPNRCGLKDPWVGFLVPAPGAEIHDEDPARRMLEILQPAKLPTKVALKGWMNQSESADYLTDGHLLLVTSSMHVPVAERMARKQPKKGQDTTFKLIPHQTIQNYLKRASAEAAGASQAGIIGVLPGDPERIVLAAKDHPQFVEVAVDWDAYANLTVGTLYDEIRIGVPYGDLSRAEAGRIPNVYLLKGGKLVGVAQGQFAIPFDPDAISPQTLQQARG